MAHFFASLLAILQAAGSRRRRLARRALGRRLRHAAGGGARLRRDDRVRAAAKAASSSPSISIAARSAGALDVATPFTPATGEGLVFTASDQAIEARDAQTGATRWRTPLPGGAAAPLYWDTGWLLASTTAGDLAAFRAADGALVWRRQLGAPLVGRPGPALDRLFLPLADNRLVSVLLTNGETVWARKLAARDHRRCSRSTISWCSAPPPRIVMSINLTSGRERWTMAARRRHRRHAGRRRQAHLLRRRATTCCAPSIARAATCDGRRDLPSRPAGGPLRSPTRC